MGKTIAPLNLIDELTVKKIDEYKILLIFLVLNDFIK